MITRLHDYTITRLHDYMITWLYDYMITWLHAYMLTCLHDYMITWGDRHIYTSKMMILYQQNDDVLIKKRWATVGGARWFYHQHAGTSARGRGLHADITGVFGHCRLYPAGWRSWGLQIGFRPWRCLFHSWSQPAAACCDVSHRHRHTLIEFYMPAIDRPLLYCIYMPALDRSPLCVLCVIAGGPSGCTSPWQQHLACWCRRTTHCWMWTPSRSGSDF